MSESWPIARPSRAAPSRVPKDSQPSIPQSSRMIWRTRRAMSTIASTTPASRRPSNGRWIRPHLSMKIGIPLLSTNWGRPSPPPNLTVPAKSSSSPETIRTSAMPSRRRRSRLGHSTVRHRGCASVVRTTRRAAPSIITSSEPEKPSPKCRPASSTRIGRLPTRRPSARARMSLTFSPHPAGPDGVPGASPVLVPSPGDYPVPKRADSTWWSVVRRTCGGVVHQRLREGALRPEDPVDPGALGEHAPPVRVAAAGRRPRAASCR